MEKSEIVCGIPGVGKDRWIRDNLPDFLNTNTNRLLMSCIRNDNLDPELAFRESEISLKLTRSRRCRSWSGKLPEKRVASVI